MQNSSEEENPTANPQERKRQKFPTQKPQNTKLTRN